MMDKGKRSDEIGIFKNIDFFTFGFIFALTITVIGSLSSIYFTVNISNGIRNMYENDLAGANYIQSARIDLLNIENEQKIILLDENNASIEKNIGIMMSYKNQFNGHMKKAEPLFASKAGRKYFDDAMLSSDNYFKIIDEFLDDLKKDKKKAVMLTLTEVNNISLELDQKLDRLDNYKQTKNLNSYSTVSIIFQTNLLIIVLILLISIIIRIYLFINQKKQIKEMTEKK
jgi:hypothetical protein